MRSLIRSFWLLALLVPVVGLAGAGQQGGGAGTAEGKAIYDKECRRCHGVQGIPPQSMKRLMPKLPVLDAAWASKTSEAAVVEVLKKGKGDTMKSFAGQLTPEQMTAVAKYVRELGTASGQK
jgi:mono/diheme cytochrome c family protein